MKTRVSAYGLVIDEGRILLTQLADFCYRPGHWTLPGGGMEHGEQPEETLVRELREETGLVAHDLSLFHVHAFSESSRGLYMGVQIVYRASATGTPSVQEVGGSTAAAAWVPLSQLAELPRVPGLDVVLGKLGMTFDNAAPAEPTKGP